MRLNPRAIVIIGIGILLIAGGGLMTVSWIVGNTSLRTAVSHLLRVDFFSWGAGISHLASGVMLITFYRRRMARSRNLPFLPAAMALLILTVGGLTLANIVVIPNPPAIQRIILPPTRPATPLPISLPPGTITVLIGAIGFIALPRLLRQWSLVIGGILIGALALFLLTRLGLEGIRVLLLLLSIGFVLVGAEEQLPVPVI